MLRVQPVHATGGPLAASSRPRVFAQALRDGCDGFAGFDGCERAGVCGCTDLQRSVTNLWDFV